MCVNIGSKSQLALKLLSSTLSERNNRMPDLQKRVVLVVGLVVASALFVLPAFATTENFNALPTGTVVAGTNTSGGTEPGTILPLMTVSVTNTGGGPHSTIIFDSANPDPGCEDLGTPNQDFAGPGIGNGGESGQPGQNSIFQGNLLIVAENVVDLNNDTFVDHPDDEAGGGFITFDFDVDVNLISVTLIDIDNNESCTIDCYKNGGLVASMNAQSLGNNSYQVVVTNSHQMIDQMVITFSNSGAIAEFEYEAIVPTEDSTWGNIKNIYR